LPNWLAKIAIEGSGLSYCTCSFCPGQNQLKTISGLSPWEVVAAFKGNFFCSWCCIYWTDSLFILFFLNPFLPQASELQTTMMEMMEAAELEKQKHNHTRMEVLGRLAKLEVL